MTIAYLSLGSNQGDRLKYLVGAVQRLNANGLTVNKVSSVYETAPQGKTDQPAFLNIAVAVRTEASAAALLQQIQRVEREMGRVRHERWGPRTLDIDIILFGDETHATEGLEVPHPRMGERAFVLVPLTELNHDVRAPGIPRPVVDVLRALPDQGVRLHLAAQAFQRLITAGGALMKLTGKRVACLLGDDYEDLEVWYPVLRLQEEGAEVHLVGLEASQPHTGKHGYPAKSTHGITAVTAADYDAIIVPGGWMPDKLRRYDSVLSFVREFDQAGKVVATICHGPWILVSAKMLSGRTLTCTPGIKDDVINAGATYLDEEAVRDGNLISARRPGDLPAFCRLIITAMAER